MKVFESTEIPGRRYARVAPLRAAALGGLAASFLFANAGARVIPVSLDWTDIASVSTAAVTIEVCVEPPLRRGHPIHDELFAALHNLGADYAHLQPFNIFPRLAVAELDPPAGGRTFWDFSAIDPIVADFIRATAGHPVVFNFGTLPAWIFQTRQPAAVARDPDQVTWTYSEFNKAQVTAEAVRRAAAYQARLASWYVAGGLTDELGHWHSSGHHYHIDYWEVLNDPDFEDSLSPAEYTRLYDAIVSAVRGVAPGMKFMGPAVGDVAHARFFAYFLDPAHHRPGIPIDMLSYHLWGVRKILFVNKRAADEELRIAGAAGGTVQMVDESTAASPLTRRLGVELLLRLPPLAVAVVTLGR